VGCLHFIFLTPPPKAAQEKRDLSSYLYSANKYVSSIEGIAKLSVQRSLATRVISSLAFEAYHI